ncbi:hypothetical protein GYMLUDRAFT_89668 [Collybiopsis luxurians FD-317 M1]|nr:hypothetical protein GYMLUDRAFT_89668 [Collybiopsis luxurians FD-317 M1]
MPPPIIHPSLNLILLPSSFFVSKLLPTDPVPQSILDSLASSSHKFLNLTRTLEETSIVGEWHDAIPSVFQPDACWRCIKIQGPMEFALVGVLAELTAPLKKASIGVFVMSTWNTDYLLVNERNIDLAVQVLKGDGWSFVENYKK